MDRVSSHASTTVTVFSPRPSAAILSSDASRSMRWSVHTRGGVAARPAPLRQSSRKSQSICTTSALSSIWLATACSMVTSLGASVISMRPSGPATWCSSVSPSSGCSLRTNQSTSMSWYMSPTCPMSGADPTTDMSMIGMSPLSPAGVKAPACSKSTYPLRTSLPSASPSTARAFSTTMTAGPRWVLSGCSSSVSSTSSRSTAVGVGMLMNTQSAKGFCRYLPSQYASSWNPTSSVCCPASAERSTSFAACTMLVSCRLRVRLWSAFSMRWCGPLRLEMSFATMRLRRFSSTTTSSSALSSPYSTDPMGSLPFLLASCSFCMLVITSFLNARRRSLSLGHSRSGLGMARKALT
mmetsp:Transcript_8413/g.27493  ORF Transcript_8413/g.27493 Transcript_8413/m.27493 type:complete len:353 (-) Transcript_8413:292-1350(-)